MLGGDFELSWRAADLPSDEAQPVLEVTVNVMARIDGRQIATEAVLTATSQAGPFDSFQVRLPPESELVLAAEPGYKLATPEAAPSTDAGQTLVDVQLDQPTKGPVEVRIQSRRAHGDSQPEGWLELAGFEVVAAARQSGTIAVAAPADWQVLWGPSRGVRQVDQLPDPLRRDDVVAGFEYDGQPYALAARLVPRRTRIAVEPRFVLQVSPDRLELDARLKYTVRGAKVSMLEVALDGWEVAPENVGPESLVAVDGVAVNEAEILSVPLVQPASGQFELRLRASRPLAPQSDALQVTLPQPQGHSLSPAEIVVLPDDNVELIPDGAAIQGLIRQQQPPSIELPPRQQDPIFYRGDRKSVV